MIEIEEKNFRTQKTDIALFQAGYRNLPKALADYGFKAMREGQDKVVLSILGGNDTICIMNTAAGKTASFILPAMCHNWRILIFSPLKALMRDQVKALQAKGIVALKIDSDSTETENARSVMDWMHGRCKVLYVAPERLRNEHFLAALKHAPPDMIAVDEAHCLSSWSDNFRHSYHYIGDIIDRFNPRVVCAFTATFSKIVELDVRRVLRIPDAGKITHFPQRKNLILSSSNLDDYNDLADRVKEIQGSVLVYCGTKKLTELTATELSRKFRKEVGFYHSEVKDSVKKRHQDAFLDGSIEIMCATNAFGMGIDKPDIRSVIHLSHPGDPEALSQEIGRAGRDGKDSWCHTYQSKDALRLQQDFLRSGHPSEDMIRRVIKTFDKAADAAGLFHLTWDEIATRSQVPANALIAIMQTLMGCKVIEDASDQVRMHKIKILGEDHGKWFAKTMEAIEVIGANVADSWKLFDLDLLSEKIGLGSASLRKYITQWDRDKVISYDPPPVGKAKRLLGGADLVDYARLELKRNLAYGKLKYVQAYFDVPDADKHDYLQEYFLEHLDAEV